MLLFGGWVDMLGGVWWGGGGGQLTFWGRGVQYKRESLQILDLQKLLSPLTFELLLCSE